MGEEPNSRFLHKKLSSNDIVQMSEESNSRVLHKKPSSKDVATTGEDANSRVLQKKRSSKDVAKMSEESNSRTLQKKLRELEYMLRSKPADQSLHLVCEEIEKSMNFVKKILSAEIQSQLSMPRHLRHAQEKLVELDAEFSLWKEFEVPEDNESLSFKPWEKFHIPDNLQAPENQLANQMQVTKMIPDENENTGSALDTLDSSSVCTQNETVSEGEVESPGNGMDEKFFEAGTEEEKVVPRSFLMKSSGEGKGKGKRDGVLGKYIGVLACGVVLGAVLMGSVIEDFSDSFGFIEQPHGILRPT